MPCVLELATYLKSDLIVFIHSFIAVVLCWLCVLSMIFVIPVNQICQLPRISRESHGFLQFLQSHGRGNSCSRVYSCPTVLFSHRLLPIHIAGNTFWQHIFSVNKRRHFFCDREFPWRDRSDVTPCLVSMDGSLSASSAVVFPNL